MTTTPSPRPHPAAQGAAGDFTIRETTRDANPAPCPDCGRAYMMGETVEVRVQERPGPVWTGCIDCWVRRTGPEACTSFATTPSPAVPGPDHGARERVHAFLDEWESRNGATLISGYIERLWVSDLRALLAAAAPTPEPMVGHDALCEAEWLLPPGRWTDCRCADRLAAVAPTEDAPRCASPRCNQPENHEDCCDDCSTCRPNVTRGTVVATHSCRAEAGGDTPVEPRHNLLASNCFVAMHDAIVTMTTAMERCLVCAPPAEQAEPRLRHCENCGSPRMFPAKRPGVFVCMTCNHISPAPDQGGNQ